MKRRSVTYHIVVVLLRISGLIAWELRKAEYRVIVSLLNHVLLLEKLE